MRHQRIPEIQGIIEEALDAKNFAQLLLWTIAWAAGEFGVFLLIKTIEIW